MKTALCLVACLFLPGSVVLAADRIAILVVTFPVSDPPREETMLWTQQAAALSDSFYAEQSYGLFTPTTDTYGIYTVPLDTTARREDIAREAKLAATVAGVDLLQYQHFVYVSPTTDTVRAGYGDAFGVWIALAPFTAAPQFHMLAHELGHHLFGLNHAHSLVCSDGSPMGTARNATCQTWEYGDTLDVMGEGEGHFTAYTKSQLGWLMLQTVTANGDYFIAPYERIQAGDVKALAFRDKRGFAYTLEYRQPVGFDVPQPYARPENVFNGVVAHVVLNGTELLRLTPPDAQSGTAIDLPALTVGETWCQKDGGFSITTLSADADGAVVRMKLKGACH